MVFQETLARPPASSILLSQTTCESPPEFLEHYSVYDSFYFNIQLPTRLQFYWWINVAEYISGNIPLMRKRFVYLKEEHIHDTRADLKLKTFTLIFAFSSVCIALINSPPGLEFDFVAFFKISTADATSGSDQNTSSFYASHAQCTHRSRWNQER